MSAIRCFSQRSKTESVNPMAAYFLIEWTANSCATGLLLFVQVIFYYQLCENRLSDGFCAFFLLLKNLLNCTLFSVYIVRQFIIWYSLLCNQITDFIDLVLERSHCFVVGYELFQQCDAVHWAFAAAMSVTSCDQSAQ